MEELSNFLMSLLRTIIVTFVVISLEWVTLQIINPKWLINEVWNDLYQIENGLIEIDIYLSNTKNKFLEYREKTERGLAWGVNLGITSFALVFAELEFWISKDSNFAIFYPFDNGDVTKDIEIWFIFIFFLFVLLCISIYNKNLFLNILRRNDQLFILTKIVNRLLGSIDRGPIFDKDLCSWISNLIGIFMLIAASFVLTNMSNAGVI